VSDEESADHVDRREYQRKETEPPGKTCVLTTVAKSDDREECADDGDARNRIRARHQRSVQGGGNLGDDLEAHENREHENRQQSDQGCPAFTLSDDARALD